ncbi:MAG: prenyltransferase, partial [Sphingobacteriia bacterium]
MPVFWFALSLQSTIYWPTVLLLFVVLHLLVYPSSNGYNSYMDRDETSIGGIEKPPPPEKELWMVTIVMDVLAILLASFISFTVAGLLLVYIIFSRLYSYRGVRLKKYPIIGYLTVVLNQGLLVFVM